MRNATQWFKENVKDSITLPFGCYLMLQYGNLQHWHWEEEALIAIAKDRGGVVTIIE